MGAVLFFELNTRPTIVSGHPNEKPIPSLSIYTDVNIPKTSKYTRIPLMLIP